jgi:hypothetical protein
MCENEARRKFCSIRCGVNFANSKRKVSLGWIKHKPKEDYFCHWCFEKLNGQRRKFCCQTHAMMWQAKNRPETLRRAGKKWRKSLPSNHPLKIRRRLSSSIRRMIKSRGGKKQIGTKSLTGCSVNELMAHIEKKFKPGMNWNNRATFGWHIDHIRPCASFDLTNPDEQKKCFHYTNLQPLWWNENVAKSDRYLKMPVRRVKI